MALMISIYWNSKDYRRNSSPFKETSPCAPSKGIAVKLELFKYLYIN
jgi:hypothetical protein